MNNHQSGLKTILTTLSLLLFCAVASLQAAPGDLDTTFAGTGKVRTGFGFGNEFGRAAVVQSDSKLVVAGYGGGSDLSGDVALVRYNTDSSLDASFGVGGKVISHLAAGAANIAAVRVQGDGKIVVAGFLQSGTKSDLLVIRYNTDGSPDTSFDADGIVITSIAATVQGTAMIIDANGKIVVAGYNHGSNGSNNTVLVRYNADGSLDGSFGGGGKVINPVDDTVRGITLQADGKIITVGGFYEIRTTRYNVNGSLDATFGTGGRVIADITTGLDYGNAVAIQPNINFTGPDKIVVVGTSGLGSASGQNSQFAVLRYNLDGTPDTSFNGNGIVATDIGANQDEATSVVIQTIGTSVLRIFVAGTTRSGGFNKTDFAVVRYNIDGTRNTGFDGDGIVVTPISPIGGDDDAYAIRLQAGKLVVAGSSVTNEGNRDFAVVRYDPVTGALDPTFDGDGIKTEDIFDRNASFGRSTAIQPDGKIVVAGVAETGQSTRAFAVSRYNPDGTLDFSFSGDGKVTTEINGYSEGNAVAIQADGKIVVAGSSGSSTTSFALVRYNPDGTLDSSFGANGKVSTVIGANSLAKSLAIQADGKIVVAGNTNNSSNNNSDFAVVRYLTNGTPDTSFGSGGIVTTGIGGDDQAASVKIQSDGKIVVAGSAVVGKSEIALVRYNPNGTLDPTFGSFGRVATDLGGALSLGLGMALQADGKIVVAGTNVNDTSTAAKFAVVRYLANGSPDTSFDGDGVVTTAIGVSFDFGYAVAIQVDGKIVVAGGSSAGSSSDFAVARYNPNGSLDNFFGIGGKMIVDVSSGGNDIGYSIALDSSGRAVLAGESAGLFGVVRFSGDPAPTPTPTPTPSASPSPTASSVYLGNIATRLKVEAGDNTLIGGFIVTGPAGATKKVLIRGLGPTLAKFGVPGVLPDPLLELRDGAGGLIASNNNWQDGDTSQIPESFRTGIDPLESIVVRTLTVGNNGSTPFTAILKGANGETGVSLAEVYDVDTTSLATLGNISTRGYVQQDDNVMIGGFIVSGSGQEKLAIRALGPTLGGFGITNPLADPLLELHDANGTILTTNDNWQDTQAAAIQASGFAPPNASESVILTTLAPAGYTAIVRGVGNTIGVALVEIYTLK